jgi:hypothetical protein
MLFKRAMSDKVSSLLGPYPVCAGTIERPGRIVL